MSALTVVDFFANIPAVPAAPPNRFAGNTPAEQAIVNRPLGDNAQARLFQFRCWEGVCCARREAVTRLYDWPCLFGKPTHCGECGRIEESARVKDAELFEKLEKARLKEKRKTERYAPPAVIGETRP